MPKTKQKKHDLENLQQNFVGHIFNRGNLLALDNLGYSKQEALARLNIYRNNVFGSFEEVLSAIFEVTKKNIGEEKFSKLVEKYSLKHCSKSGNLDEFGDEFPNFIKRIKPTFLSDLASLELFYHLAYFAADAEPFKVEEFQKIAPENFQNLSFVLHPSCFLFKSKFKIFSIWKNNKKSKITTKESEFLLIERALGKVQVHKLSQAEFIFLDNLNSGKKLFDTYKKIHRITNPSTTRQRRFAREPDIGKILSKFISLGIISNFN